MKLNHQILNLSGLSDIASGTPQYGTTTQLYEKTIPSFADEEMEYLYESLYSSITQIKSRQNTCHTDVDTYVVREKGKPTTILLLRRNGNTAEVLNEVLTIEEQTIRGFAKHIFTAFPSISVISFHAIHTNIRNSDYPFQRFNILEDIVLSLPPSEDEYLARLGKSTRRTIKYYTNKLMRNFPSFQYQVYTKENISKEHIRDIIGLKTARMTLRNKVASIPEEDLDRMWGLIEKYGVVGVATIDGQICAGWIGYRIGKNDFMNVIAHAHQYDDYRLGTLCGYFAIRDCILRGGKECHFQWGQDEYKLRFLGEFKYLDDIVIYRSFASMLTNPRVVLQAARKRIERRLRLWVGQLKKEDSSIFSSSIKPAMLLLRRLQPSAANR